MADVVLPMSVRTIIDDQHPVANECLDKWNQVTFLLDNWVFVIPVWAAEVN